MRIGVCPRRPLPLLFALAVLISACGSDEDPPPAEEIYGYIDHGGLSEESITDLSVLQCQHNESLFLFVPAAADPGADPERSLALTFRSETNISDTFDKEDDWEELELLLHEDLSISEDEEANKEEAEDCGFTLEAKSSWRPTSGSDITFDDYDRAHFDLDFTELDEDGELKENGTTHNVKGCWVVSRNGTDCTHNSIPAP